MYVVCRKLRWAGHVQRMSEERLTTSTWKTEESSRKRRGRPKLRWRDSAKRVLGRAEHPGIVVDTHLVEYMDLNEIPLKY